MTSQRSASAAPVSVDRIQHTFVVRMWWESNSGERPGEWRGSIEHVRSRTKRYFRDRAALPELVTAMIATGGIDAPDLKAGEHSSEDL